MRLWCSYITQAVNGGVRRTYDTTAAITAPATYAVAATIAPSDSISSPAIHQRSTVTIVRAAPTTNSARGTPANGRLFAHFEGETDRPDGAFLLAMRMPGLDSPDFPALEVLSDVLNSERGDLYALVPEGKALAAGFYLGPLAKIGFGYASISFPAGSDAKAAETELRTVLAKILREGVPAGLVEAAKIQEERQAEFQKNSIGGLASICRSQCCSPSRRFCSR